MNRLHIDTDYPHTVLTLLKAYDLIEIERHDVLAMPAGSVAVRYPDDGISQALAFWFALAVGCGLVKDWRLEQGWEKR